ncbi:MAG: leucine-rich repeat protein [Angelakisella sp.]|nr:leucine-rich repeat protein [Angelakisella sp.]
MALICGYMTFPFCIKLRNYQFLKLLPALESAFSSCSALKELVIPDGVTEIGESAFMGSGLRRMKISAGLTELSNGIFFHCDDPGQMLFGNVESFSRSIIRAVRSKEGKFFLARETFPCTMLR